MTRHRGELSDTQWARLAPLLPPERPKKPGHPWQSHRTVLNGILWRLRTGAPWRDVPARYGPWQTCYDRYVRWQQQGLWIQIRQALQAREDAAGRLHWAAGRLDSTIVRAHQPAAGAPGGPSGPQREALGCRRGGLTPKIHLLCDAAGRPRSLYLRAGPASDSKHLAPTLDRGRVPRGGRGRPRQRVGRVLLDKGYSYARCRRALRRRQIGALIPERRDQQARRAARSRRGGRPPYFKAGQYRRRSWVERCSNRLKQGRAVATRYEKRASHYLGLVTLAAIMIWLN
jgi:transposase